ncbi:rod-binding protein [Entomospira entomophila]|uniref:Flagellar protein FlgJ N-terminal domain-containing protein n=1 Tax=Entomospira entomophila TaxID=2719988 RepID=A0A968KW58_9SPIO|nr:rod-binding protein [Entomospira entomophilus]NIZ40500.1 hypothetical protein [Entomospira entomophilus]WDI36059.1 rod-binding protein [Entomospira entomophilus]
MNITQFSRNLPENDVTKQQEQYKAQMDKLQSLASAEYDINTMTESEIQALKETTQGIEQIFVKMLTDQMRKSIQRESSDSAAQNQGRDIFEEMLYDEYGKKLTQQGGFGLADSLFNQLTTPVIRPKDLDKLYQNQTNTQVTPKSN